jgi:hypothetical protein
MIRERPMSHVPTAIHGAAAPSTTVSQPTPWPIKVPEHLVILTERVLTPAKVRFAQYFVHVRQNWIRHHDSTTVMASAASS